MTTSQWLALLHVNNSFLLLGHWVIKCLSAPCLLITSTLPSEPKPGLDILVWQRLPVLRAGTWDNTYLCLSLHSICSKMSEWGLSQLWVLRENKCSWVLSAGKLCKETKGFTHSLFSTNICFHGRKGVRFNSQTFVNGKVTTDLMVCRGQEPQGFQDRSSNRGLTCKEAIAVLTSVHTGALQARRWKRPLVVLTERLAKERGQSFLHT